jgi:histidine triad (HIT) family protein
MPDVDPDCLFCKIVAGEIPSTKVYEDGHAFAFADRNPQAPVHVLVVPRRHFTDIADLGRDADASAGLLAGIRALAAQEGLDSFRTVFNTGAEAQQTVFHVHAHVLAGRALSWPPG